MLRAWIIALTSGIAGGCFPAFDGLTGGPDRCGTGDICLEGGAPEAEGLEAAVDASSDVLTEAPLDDAPPVARPTVDDVVAAGDLVAWYRFEDATDPGRDSSRNANPSADGHGVVVTKDPHRGGVAVFDGTAGQSFPTLVRKDMTLTLWLRTLTHGLGAEGEQWYAGSGLLEADRGGTARDFGLALVATRVAFGTGDPDRSFRSLTNVTDSLWHHIAATRGDASGVLQIFVDGALEAQGPGSLGERTDATPVMRMGDRILIGQVADVRVYKRVLLADEIAKVAQGK